MLDTIHTYGFETECMQLFLLSLPSFAIHPQVLSIFDLHFLQPRTYLFVGNYGERARNKSVFYQFLQTQSEGVANQGKKIARPKFFGT